jgi:hypothetical protein
MSSNTKYTAAAQRDSFDDTAHYSQAPPSYVDEPSASNDSAALLGGPRSSEDNIPDDFKVFDLWRSSADSILIVLVVRRLRRRGDH